MNKNSDIYKKTAAVNKARKAQKIWDNAYKEQYVLDNFFCYSRGKFLVALTNKPDTITNLAVPNTPFSNGSRVCNIFYPTSDCQTV